MPGFDFNNPFGGGTDPFGDPFAARRQPALVQPLAPAEQEGVLSKLGQYGLGGLGWLGETLDKSLGGRTVRGLLGGKGVGESLAHLIPLSDTLGVTDPSQAVSGKELLGFDKHDDSWTGFLGGLGAEILLDPGTYTSFGGSAVSKLGKAAQKAGVLPKELAARARGFKFGSAEADALARQAHNIPMGPVPASAIADVADKPLGGAMTFMGNVVGGERPAALIDKAKDALLYSKPVRTLAPLFDPSLHTFGPSPYTEAGQRATRAGAEALAKERPAVLKSHFDLSNQLREAGLQNDAAGLRGVVESGGFGPMPQGKEALLEVGAPLKGQNVARLEQARDMGRKISEWESQYGEHFPRQMTPDANQALSTIKDKRFGQVQTPQSRPRIEELDIPGLTNQTNALLSDPQAAAPLGDRAARKQARKYTREALGYDQAEVNALNQIPFQPVPAGPNFPLTAEQAQRAAQLKSLRKSGNYLSDWASRLPDEFRAGLVTEAGQHVLDNAPPVVQQMLQAGTVKPQDVLKALQQPGGEDLLSRGRQFFGNSPLGDATVAQLAHQKAQEGAKVFYDTLKSAATTVKGDGHKSIAEILQKSGFQTITDASGNVRGAQPQMLQRLEAAGIIPPGSKPGVLKQVFVPGEVADDVLRFGQSFAMPENLKPVLNAWDYMTNLTKTGQTVLWPAFHARNFLSGLWQNLVGGAGYHGAGGLDLISGLRDAHTLRTGGVLPWANTVEGLRHLSPEDASRQILELAYAHGAREPAGKMVANELLGRAPHEVGAGELGSFAGRQEKPMLQSVKEGLGMLPDPTNEAAGRLGRWNPLDYSNFAPAKAGRELSHVTDDYNRLAGFLGYLQQGYNPETAAMRIKGLHWSGGGQNFAPFEREVMRRLVPFYGWSRQNIPFQLQQLLEKPGGLTAQAARATGELRQQDGLLPDWIGEGPAIPLGAREGNTQRYLSSFGLPFEDLNRIVSTGPNSTKRTMQQLLGDLNPMLKGPLEYATGMQLYSGRQMDDLYSRTGNPVLDQIVMNSPLSRALTMASTAADPRKGLTGFATNFVSPFRVTDVDMVRAADIQARRLVEEQLKGNPDVRQFVNFYLTPQQAQTVDPQTLETLRMYRTLVDQAKARSAANQPAPAFQFGR